MLRCSLLLLPLLVGCSASSSKVVLYCAQDREFAETILDQFTQQTGITVAPKFDTEANKSVSLYEEIVREANRPRCDLFWNNEILSTIRLERKGLLASYASASSKNYPDWTKGPNATWQAFAARARVLIINKNLIAEKEYPKSVFDLADPRWKGRMVMAKPQFGTTATHAACLFEVLGTEQAKLFYTELRSNQIQIVPGNKQVAQRVAKGDFALGFTDQDDAILEMQDGQPVEMVFLDRDGHTDYPRLGVLLIPNTLAIIRKAPNLDQAKQLADHLLSAQGENQLAQGGGFQIPLQIDAAVKLHRTLQDVPKMKRMEVDFYKAADLWEEVQSFLRQTFAP